MSLTQNIKKKILAPIYYKLKLFWKIARYGEDRFSNVEIEINSECNFRCPYCPVSTIPRKKGVLSTETYKRAIDQLKEINYSGIISPHFFNEPLLDERLLDLLNYTKQKLPKCHIVIFTNGSLLNLSIFEKLIKVGVEKFVISQHTPEMLPNIKKLFSEISPKERKKIKYSNLRSDSAVLVNRGGLVKDKNFNIFYYCFTPTDFLTIDYNGNVVLCCNDYSSTHIFGNVNHERLIDIWRKPQFKKTRRDIRNGKFNLKICKICSKNE